MRMAERIKNAIISNIKKLINHPLSLHSDSVQFSKDHIQQSHTDFLNSDCILLCHVSVPSEPLKCNFILNPKP
jgi:hypothetical protein